MCNGSFSRMLIVVGLLLVGSGLSSAVSAGGELPSQRELIKGIDEAAHRLKNVEVHFESWEERRQPGGAWARTGISASGTAWLDGADRKGRIHYDKEITEWRDGAAPRYEQSGDLSFDGHEGRTLVLSDGPAGQTVRTCRGEILNSAPVGLFDGPAEIRDGASFSVALAQYAGGRTLAGTLTKHLADGTSFELAADTFDGRPAYRITIRRPHGREAMLWLDPGRGYAFLGHRLTAGGKVSVESHVSKLVEAAPGVWYPAEAYLEDHAPGNKDVRERVYYRASQVVANAPKFDEAIFKVPFPADCQVQDKTKDRPNAPGPAGI